MYQLTHIQRICRSLLFSKGSEKRLYKTRTFVPLYGCSIWVIETTDFIEKTNVESESVVKFNIENLNIQLTEIENENEAK